MFAVHTTTEEFKNATITGHFGFVFRENSVREISHDCHDGIVFEKLRFQNVFRSHLNTKPAFSNSSGLKSVFEKLRFQNVFRSHLNTKPAFSNSSGLKSVFEKLRFRNG